MIRDATLLIIGFVACIIVQILYAVVDTIGFVYRILREEINTVLRRYAMQIGVIVGLALAAIWAGSVWFAFEWGGDVREDSIVAKAKQEVERLKEEHRANAVADMEVAVSLEEKRAAAERNALKKRHALELDIERKARERAEQSERTEGQASGGDTDRGHTCDLDPISYRLLIDSINASNASAGYSTSSVPAPMPATTDATGRPGSDRAPLDR